MDTIETCLVVSRLPTVGKMSLQYYKANNGKFSEAYGRRGIHTEEGLLRVAPTCQLYQWIQLLCSDVDQQSFSEQRKGG